MMVRMLDGVVSILSNVEHVPKLMEKFNVFTALDNLGYSYEREKIKIIKYEYK